MIRFIIWLYNVHCIYINLSKLNNRNYVPFNERSVDFFAFERIENGILPNETILARNDTAMVIDGFTNRFVGADHSFGRMVNPHTKVRNRIVVPYNFVGNMSGTIRIMSPYIDRHLLYSVGGKVASDCEEGFCDYVKHSRSTNGFDSMHGSLKGVGGYGKEKKNTKKPHITPQERYILDGYDDRGYPRYRNFDIDHLLDSMPSNEDDHYHYHAGHFEEKYSAIKNPFRASSKLLHVMRPNDRDYDSDTVSDYVPATFRSERIA